MEGSTTQIALDRSHIDVDESTNDSVLSKMTSGTEIGSELKSQVSIKVLGRCCLNKSSSGLRIHIGPR